MTKPPVASYSLFPNVSDDSVTNLPEPLAGPTVPFPAVLLDQAMPRLSDTEWRLLCVVVRQTLGWYDSKTGGRKQKDWLTQAQLVSRTGRTAKPVAQAIATLIAQQMIQVVSDRGEALLTQEQRRRYPGKHWFQLHPRLAKTWAEAEFEDKAVAHLSSRETPIVNEGLMRHSDIWSEAYRVFTVEKLHTTKQTDYKYIKQTNHKDISGKFSTHKDLTQKSLNPKDFNHNIHGGTDEQQGIPSMASPRNLVPEQAGEHGRGESRLGKNDPTSHGGVVLTIYGSSSPQVRAQWEQEAAGQRWLWRKDLTRWVPASAFGAEAGQKVKIAKAGKSTRNG